MGRRISIHGQDSTKETSVKERVFGCVITVGPSTCTYRSTQVTQQSKYKALPQKIPLGELSMTCLNEDKPTLL